MQNPRLAHRYAKSLFDLAKEKNAMESVLSDVRTIESVCDNNRDFSLMLRSPIINAQKKSAILEAVFSNISEITGAFLKLLVAKGREIYLPEIVKAFVAQYNEANGIKVVSLTTAVELNDTMRNAIMQKVGEIVPGSKVSVKATIDPTIIGGFILEADDKQFDASVRKKLSDMKSRLLDRSYENRM